MWRLLATFLFAAVLSGCNYITIDEEQPTNDQSSEEAEETQAENREAHTPEEIAEILKEEEDKSKLEELMESVFQLEWGSRKETGAQPIQYLALGDSLTRGIGDETGRHGYTQRLALEIENWPAVVDVELDNRGKNGRRSDKLLSLTKKGHYDEELAAADLVTITLGGNDVMKVVKKDIFSLKKSMFDKELVKFEKRYRKIVEEIRDRNSEVPIILIGFYNPFSIITDEYTPFEAIIDEWNMEIAQIASDDGNACFVPISDLFETNEEMVYHTDFFHPNASGYDRMTSRIIQYMKVCDIEEMSAGRIGFEE